jgi:hypothetical protein
MNLVNPFFLSFYSLSLSFVCFLDWNRRRFVVVEGSVGDGSEPRIFFGRELDDALSLGTLHVIRKRGFLYIRSVILM